MNLKKTFLKKLLPSLLAVMLAASSGMTLAASAKSFSDVTESYDYKEQIEILSDVGVIVGTSENEFSPEERVTREQMAMMLFRLILARDNAGSVNSTGFTDLYDATYHGAISWANAAGYIIGTSDTTFDPTGGIMLQDAMTMIVRALGQSNAGMDKGYPWTYIETAVRLGLDRGLEKVGYTDILTRGQVAAILYNALVGEYKIVRETANGSYTETSTLIESVYGYEIENAQLVATNRYALDGNDPVVKDGFVSFKMENGRVITVKYEDAHLAGEAEAWLGRSVRLIYTADEAAKQITVLGASSVGKTENAETVTVDGDRQSVTINGIRYTVVKDLSDVLSTNRNELIVYAYDNDGTLTLLPDTAALASLLGQFEMTLIYDNAASEKADRAILCPLAFGQLIVDENGAVNLAENLKTEQLTGGFDNPVSAVSGQYVFYYYNGANRSLAIRSVLPVLTDQLVTRITGNTAVIGDNTYTLGHELLGISPDAIRANLTVGARVNLVVAGDRVLAVPESAVTVTASNYLVLITKPMAVYTDGAIRYAATANINGTTAEIFVDRSENKPGAVYRFTVTENGVYTLIPASSAGFVQAGEMAASRDNMTAVTLTPSLGGHYTLLDRQFVTDEHSVITVQAGGQMYTVSGRYVSAVNIGEGASVTLICRDEPGTVETLAFLYISNGTLGETVYTENSVEILNKAGTVLADGQVGTVYTVFRFATGEVEEAISLSADLETGRAYVLDASGRITDRPATGTGSGLVTGYTASTVTIGNETYRLARDFKAVKLASDFAASSVTLKTAYMNHVTFAVSDGEITSMIVNGYPSFTAAYEDGAIRLTASATLEGVDTADVAVVSLNGNAVSGVTTAKTAENELLLSGIGSVPAGANAIVFSVNGISYAAAFTVEE